MLSHVAVGSSLLAVSLAAKGVSPNQVADPTITPGPKFNVELLKRQQDDSTFAGWVSETGKWEAWICLGGGTYRQFQTANYWDCCPSDTSIECRRFIGCDNGNLLLPGTTSGGVTGAPIPYPCTSKFNDPSQASYTNCEINFMFQSTGDISGLTNFDCGPSQTIRSWYRNEPLEAIQSTSEVSSIRSVPSTPTPTASSSSTSPTSGGGVGGLDSNDSGGGGSGSKAWIAGAVVGPLVGLALLGLLAFFCLRRRKRNQSNTTPSHHGTAAAGGAAAAGAGSYHHANSTAPHSPAPYYPPPMSHTSGTVSPTPYGGMSPHQGWQNEQYAQQSAYGHSSSSPGSAYVQPAQYDMGTYKHMAEQPQGQYPQQGQRPFSSELEGNSVQPGMGGVQGKP